MVEWFESVDDMLARYDEMQRTKKWCAIHRAPFYDRCQRCDEGLRLIELIKIAKRLAVLAQHHDTSSAPVHRPTESIPPPPVDQ